MSHKKSSLCLLIDKQTLLSVKKENKLTIAEDEKAKETTNPIQLPWSNLIAMQTSKNALAGINSFEHLKRALRNFVKESVDKRCSTSMVSKRQRLHTPCREWKSQISHTTQDSTYQIGLAQMTHHMSVQESLLLS